MTRHPYDTDRARLANRVAVLKAQLREYDTMVPPDERKHRQEIVNCLLEAEDELDALRTPPDRHAPEEAKT